METRDSSRNLSPPRNPNNEIKKLYIRGVVVAQLVEWLLPTPEVGGSNPVNWKFLYRHLFVYCQLYWKDEIKEKEEGTGPFFKKLCL